MSDLPEFEADALAEKAVAVLLRIHPGDPWHLVAISPDGIPEAKTFTSADAGAAQTWIRARQGTKNLYFHVNALRAGFANAKASKTDVVEARYLHVDIDDPTDRRFEMFNPQPTFVTFSGGGHQAFWRLREPCRDIARVERINLALAHALGGDNCHNADRIMRLPFTVNVPNARKRAGGRVPAVAFVVDEFTDWTRENSVDAFKESTAPASQPEEVRPKIDPTTLVAFGLEGLTVPEFERTLILQGDDPDHPVGSATSRYPSRSETVFRVATCLARSGYDVRTIAGVLLNPDHRISASILEKRKPQAYALRQAEKAHEVAGGGWHDVSKSGLPRSTFANTLLAISRLGIVCEYDEFHKRRAINGRAL